MKSCSAPLVLFSLFGFVLGAQKCSTQFASTSASRVPTYTKTVTTTSTSTYTYGTSYVPSPSTIDYTYISTTGKTTKTIPTGSSFTPIISAPKGPPPQGTPKAKALRKRAKYPKQVDCTSTVTTTTYKQIGTATATYTEYVTRKTYTSTKTVATATEYAACGPTNLVSTFKGQKVNYWWALSWSDMCDVNQQRYAGQEACANALACCNYAQANDYQGFIWSNTSGIHCYQTVVEWGFETGNTDTPLYIGNGPSGSGYFGPPS